jgi:hypothetical protein
MPSFLHRTPGLPFQSVKKIGRVLRFPDSAEATRQDFPVPQHGVGKESADLLNAFF